MTDTDSGLAPDALYRACDPKRLADEDPEERGEVDLMFGQDRATEALRVGIGVSA